ncbi:unnamed protein product [Commensalibacter communis]|uniref:methylamine utilization protein MauJ n=1 Tax=Commensalibacter communis TaxID=2972786 RepID=UPI0022FF8E3E|nr:methylamine utilization protein MauJ [Commensalibacter communis]CAI3934054.1 unnamed protein product [Commensalibacter communis]
MGLYSCKELIDFIIQGIIKEQFEEYFEEKFNENDDKNIIDFKEEFFNQHEDKIKILSNNLSAVYNKLKVLSISKEIILFSDHHIEIPVYFPQKLIFSLDNNYHINDKTNNIRYEISAQSTEYSLLMLNHFKILCDNKQMELNDQRIHNMLAEYFDEYRRDDFFESDFYMLRQFFETLTIKITTIDAVSLKDLQKLTEIFTFQVMITNNTSCAYYTNMFDVLMQNVFTENERSDLNKPSSAPHRVYRDHIIDYYSLALSSSEPFTQYLSYYHVLEYFYDEVFNENLRKEFQDKITHPNFSYKDNKALDKIINFVKKETRNCKENGQGNELESLKQVLKKFIDRDELQEKLNSKQIEYFQKNQVSFSHAPTFSFKDKEGFYNNLAQRIYQTRNSLVHSKEGNVGRYKPYQDSEELSKEIPLIKLVAEQVIINSSTPL